MRYLLLILGVLVLNANVFSGNYVAESELGQDGAEVYPDRTAGRCQAIKGEPCFDLTGKPADEHSIQTVQVDDMANPRFGPKLKLSVGLADLAACQAAMPGHCDDQDPGYGVHEVCQIEGAGPTHELYCAAVDPRSYVQKDEDQYLPDAAKRATKTSTRNARLQIETDAFNSARDCYIKHRDGVAVAGDVIGCQKALFDLMKEVVKVLK